MGRARVSIRVVDVDRSLARFIRRFPGVVKGECATEVRQASRAVLQGMEGRVAVGPDAPHLKDDLSYEAKGLVGRVGILEDAAGKQAAPGSDATQGEVASFNEWSPDHQPFMGNSARAAANDFAAGVAKALQRAARSMSGGF